MKVALHRGQLGTVPKFPGRRSHPVLECALAASAEAIISNDSHLLTLETFRDIPILTPAACLEKYKLG